LPPSNEALALDCAPNWIHRYRNIHT